MKINIGIVVPTLKNLVGGYEALASIQGTDQISWTPIIIDNWRESRILSHSWNIGVERAKDINCNLVCIINDDILFAPNTLQGLFESWCERPADTVVVTGQNIKSNFENPYDILTHNIDLNKQPEFVEAPDFACFMTSVDIFQTIGSFDENFAPAYFEDNDYHRRINLLGYHAMSCSWAEYYHYGSVTQNFGSEAAVQSSEFDLNRQYYIDKWGGDLGQESFIHPYNDPSLTPKDWLPNMR